MVKILKGAFYVKKEVGREERKRSCDGEARFFK